MMANRVLVRLRIIFEMCSVLFCRLASHFDDSPREVMATGDDVSLTVALFDLLQNANELVRGGAESSRGSLVERVVVLASLRKQVLLTAFIREVFKAKR
jgi:hypothetical protein